MIETLLEPALKKGDIVYCADKEYMYIGNNTFKELVSINKATIEVEV